MAERAFHVARLPGFGTTAIIVFAPLSGCSQIIGRMHLKGYRCSVLSVDRPSCAETSAVAKDVEEEETTHRGRTWLCGIGSRRSNTDSKMKKRVGDDANANANDCNTSNPSSSKPSNPKTS